MATNKFTTYDGAFKVYENTLELYIWVETAQAAKDAVALIAELNAQQEKIGDLPFNVYRLRPTHDLAAIRKHLIERGFKEANAPAEAEAEAE
jgi:hypothetical protein